MPHPAEFFVGNLAERVEVELGRNVGVFIRHVRYVEPEVQIERLARLNVLGNKRGCGVAFVRLPVARRVGLVFIDVVYDQMLGGVLVELA